MGAAFPVPEAAVRFTGAFAVLRADVPGAFLADAAAVLVPAVFAEVRADAPVAFFAPVADVRAVAPDFFAPVAGVRAVVPVFFAPAPEARVVVPEAFLPPALRAAEDAEVRTAPLPPLPACFRGCVSISKFASSRALRSLLMNPKHSMFPV